VPAFVELRSDLRGGFFNCTDRTALCFSAASIPERDDPAYVNAPIAKHPAPMVTKTPAKGSLAASIPKRDDPSYVDAPTAEILRLRLLRHLPRVPLQQVSLRERIHLMLMHLLLNILRLRLLRHLPRFPLQQVSLRGMIHLMSMHLLLNILRLQLPNHLPGVTVGAGCSAIGAST